MEDLQQHLLTSCAKTLLSRKKFQLEIAKISGKYHHIFNKLSNEQKCIWMLTSGDKITNEKQNQNITIFEGKSVADHIDKTNDMHKFQALEEHDLIKSSIPKHDIIIYTDGSKTEEKVGAGSVIFQHYTQIATTSTKLQHCENNAAELYAILDALTWIHEHVQNTKHNKVHIFSDSRYSIDILSQQSQNSKHRRLIEQIHHASFLIGTDIVLHWIPSHIELFTQRGKRYIKGNSLADTLANVASKSNMNPINYASEYIKHPSMLQNTTATLVYNIDKQIHRKWECSNSQNAGPSSDDFSISDAQQILRGESVTS